MIKFNAPINQLKKSAIALAFVLFSVTATAQSATNNHAQPTVAKLWSEAVLYAIREDLARPTVHARNLYHVSAAMYDAWAVYDENAIPVFMGTSTLAECQFSAEDKSALQAANTDTDSLKSARQIALGHAAWSVLNYRFKRSVRNSQILAYLNLVALSQGLEKIDEQSTDNTNPAVLGLRIANCIIAIGAADASNEANDYENTNYASVNPPLSPYMAGNPDVVNINRWQPIQLDVFIDQSGNTLDAPSFLGANWGQLDPFAMTAADKSIVTIDGVEVPVWLDPGAPPQLTDDPSANRVFQMGNALVAMWSAQLDPNNAATIDISPGVIGNLGPLSALGNSQAELLLEYDGINGGLGRAVGHALNPHTGVPYASNVVPLGDYTRVLAEFWADGPGSETPPGHWFSIYNQVVVGHASHETLLGGSGEPVDALQYDVMAYLALGGAMHDSAIAAWSVKRAYDYVRPISAIRYMAALGQSSDNSAPNYHIHGIPLVPGLIETVGSDDALAGSDNEHVGKIKGFVWRGPDYIANPSTDVAGVSWILLERWWPYQRPTFVTPPFAGYVSGHSTFSSAAAQVLTQLTGDAFFPDGLAEFVAEKDDYLVFERGPSVEVKLQWATYRDAADQTSLSRIWGGIHPPADDIVGRRMGEQIGMQAWQRVLGLAQGSDNNGDSGSVMNDANESFYGGGCSLAINNPQTPMFILFCLIALARIFRKTR